MMSNLYKTLSSVRIPQWILLGAGLLGGGGSLLLGVSDNPPGIALLYFALACLAGAWVWKWPSAREYWQLLIASLAAFPVGGVLHNLLYALGTVVQGIPVIQDLVGFLEVFFFLVAVIAAPPAALVALLGGISVSWQGMSRLTRLNRSVRRFKEAHRIKEKTLRKLINLTRQSASSANLQPLKYVLSFQEQSNLRIFPTLSWAGYLKEWNGPDEGERPAAYIIVVGDRELAKSFQYDAGIACQSITLGAVELGLGACLIGSIKREQLRSELAIPERYEILLVIALGKPAENVVLDEVDENGGIKYWRDTGDRHHVPKRRLGELILDSK
ncbi:MAG: nitroreductase family protein [Anaerolineales bacterium]